MVDIFCVKHESICLVWHVPERSEGREEREGRGLRTNLPRPSLRSGTCHTIDKGSRSAFTLLEVLLASVLSATLLLTLWSLIGTYTSLFSSGGAKIEQSQIARSLLQQMSDDLRGAIQDTAARQQLHDTKAQTKNEGEGGTTQADSSADLFGGSSDNSSDDANVTANTVRRFGLFGTQHELRIDVLQIVPLEVSLAAYGSDDDRGKDSLLADEPRRRAPELRTVCYTFNKPREVNELESSEIMSAADENGLPAAGMEEELLGLVREEIDFETRDPSASGTRLAARLTKRSADNTSAEKNGFEQFDAAVGEETDSEIDARIDSGAVLWVPEVVGLEFRYFDGSGWTSQWDSIARKSLPAAVEIRMQIESLDPRAVRRREAAKAAGETVGDEVEFVSGAGGAGEDDSLSTDEIRLQAEEDAGAEAGREAGAESEPTDYETYRLVVELPAANLHKGPRKAAAMARERPQPLSAQQLEPSTLPLPTPPASKPSKDKKASEQWLRTNPQ